MKPQCPENQFVVINPSKGVQRVHKSDIVPIDVIIEVLGEEQRHVFTESPDGEPKIDEEVISFLILLLIAGGIHFNALHGRRLDTAQGRADKNRRRRGRGRGSREREGLGGLRRREGLVGVEGLVLGLGLEERRGEVGQEESHGPLMGFWFLIQFQSNGRDFV